MKRIGAFLRSAAAVLAAGLLTGCAPAVPNEPLAADLTPSAQEDCVTPPFWVVEDSSTGAKIFMLGSMNA